MITAEQLAGLDGEFWWQRPDGSLYATAEREPESGSDIYLLRASERWLAQWGGDWQAAADQINAAIARQEGP